MCGRDNRSLRHPITNLYRLCLTYYYSKPCSSVLGEFSSWQLTGTMSPFHKSMLDSSTSTFLKTFIPLLRMSSSSCSYTHMMVTHHTYSRYMEPPLQDVTRHLTQTCWGRIASLFADTSSLTTTQVAHSFFIVSDLKRN